MKITTATMDQDHANLPSAPTPGCITISINTAELLILVAKSPKFAQQLAKQLAGIARLPVLAAGPDFYTANEAAVKTGLCRKTITRRIQAGIIPTMPGVKPYRIPRTYVDRLSNP